ncbi:nicotinate (nicotinamide) nucleotide adenylyltransferase [Desulfatibacillum aliphaticivorans]|uniref:Probable nicotinate-nucleotide adenylyltransferase n=1 Tax=Desulfatibacillum aliphaticivorans TaxID=218208 RepID=NADD_DESAL|nr:nicotinate-nucleotide adenylyltransferase [Desulfatibacillum aliphaticivorans]B8FMU1.1 RecName: Full=Probable nicotinate-nucleotide adenylyltransferase; AltName: Full=Deamido-NAD(+) diphosphorylase; AltName: Full=Deamido-NAD(+) pyrophosphorylase; AltName: Full=Nicotinate mononucleotide adenylyltransferase; Short=NaMN adenylyltransferase [Desulfatibacillum aliphaticivorans]ACL05811.1 nicotinate (nicotinamide) nucleotide adenylyltransferase [Desulfatibacillum aliphaticivorans]
MRLGIYGGTFDPIHIGHLRMAVEVQEKFSLDKVVLIPCNTPPHKENGAAASARDRLAMVRMAVEGRAGLEASDMEISQGGPSYTVATLEALQSPDKELFFILGLDAFLEIHTWKEYERLFSLAHFIVLARPWQGDRAEMFHVEQYIRENLPGLAVPEPDQGYFRALHENKRIYFAQTTALDISATHIRKTVNQGKSIAFLAPESVEKYIKRQGLYL